MSEMYVPFNRPYMTGHEIKHIEEAHRLSQLAGNGAFTKKCQHWLEAAAGAQKVLLTHSCTGALELAALLLKLEPGDEVIMPSYTFVSTANAFMLRGAIPVFVDIRKDTLNIDESLIEDAITSKTKCIVVVHYAGVSCEMDSILSMAEKHGLPVVEDAAQGVLSAYKGRALGGLGDIGCYSFHETKNIISGEGGAIAVNDIELFEMAEIHWEKGTNRSQFFRGEADKYTWQNLGSSFLPGELIAAFLWAQLEDANHITQKRIDSWNYYHSLLEGAEGAGLLRRPVVPDNCTHNAHMYYILVPGEVDRVAVLEELKQKGVNAVFHYVPLHNSPFGSENTKMGSELRVTEDLSSRIVRLPLWVGITHEEQDHVVNALVSILERNEG